MIFSHFVEHYIKNDRKFISSYTHAVYQILKNEDDYIDSHFCFNASECDYPAHSCKKSKFHILVCWPVIVLKQEAMDEYNALKHKKRVRVN